jgi:hypothetical protein
MAVLCCVSLVGRTPHQKNERDFKREVSDEKIYAR